MSKLKTKNLKLKNGFTLMEVMVAIFIIVVGLFAVMALIDKSIMAGSLSTNKLIAANLAQEGIEVVKSIRDMSYDPATGGWDVWYGASGVASGTYSVEHNSQNFGSSQNSLLKFDSASGLYSYSSGNNSIFKRSIIITKAPAGNADEIKVEAIVTWTERGANKTLTVEDRLWNWR